jgi:hypothetical protein
MFNTPQSSLFGEKIISTISYEESEIIGDILYLHANGKNIDCDPTYSIGKFYKHEQKPKYKFDKFPQINGVIQADACSLPLEDESVEVIMFDPPFVIGGKVKSGPEDSNIIAKRFTNFLNFEELKDMYSGALKEFHRILKSNGIVIFKCQDVVVSAKNHFTHCWVMMEAIQQGLYPKDLFIYVVENRIIGKMNKQQHARKYHSYFWVLEKSECKIKY